MVLRCVRKISGRSRAGGGLRRLFEAGGDGVICPDCLGEKRVEGERVVGGYDRGNPWQGYESCLIECERCLGTGEVEDEEC